jgi:hypothetical protein
MSTPYDPTKNDDGATVTIGGTFPAPITGYKVTPSPAFANFFTVVKYPEKTGMCVCTSQAAANKIANALNELDQLALFTRMIRERNKKRRAAK